MAEVNGRIKLTWAQVAWGLAVLVALVGGWYDIRYQVRTIMVAVESHEERLSRLELRNERVGFTRPEAEALRDEIIKTVKGGKR